MAEEPEQVRAQMSSADCISRQAAIDHWRAIIDATDESNRYNMGFADGLEFCISDLSTMPSAQTDMSEYSDKLWKAAYERGKAEGREKRKKGALDTSGFLFCFRRR